MLKKAGFIALPLIVLAGMRRCPQLNTPCKGCDAVADGIPQVLILASVLVLATVAFMAFKRRQA